MKKLIEMQCGNFIQIMVSYIICPDVVLSPDKFEGGPFFRIIYNAYATFFEISNKVQRANLTCDVIRKVAPFVLSKL